MKLKNNSVLSYFVAIGAMFLCIDNAVAKYCNSSGSKVGPGEYCYGLAAYSCKPGCYCKGGDNQSAGVPSCNSIMGELKFGALIKTSGFAGVYLCPKDYPLSPGGAKDATECCKACTSGTYAGDKVCNVSQKCASGKYRPKGSNDCKECPKDGKSICEGTGNFKPTCNGADSNQGIRVCDSGSHPNSTSTACESCPAGSTWDGSTCKNEQAAPTSTDTPSAPVDDNSVKCFPGEYLPGNASSCSPCPAGSYCQGGTFEKGHSIGLGIEDCGDNEYSGTGQSKCFTCETGTAPNAEHSKCESADNIYVKPGYYLPANSIEPRPCKGTKKYCPGGYYGKGTTDRGIFDCPYNSDHNKSKTGCRLELTKEQLRLGVYGKEGITTSQCWIKTDPEDYKTCIYGNRTKSLDE